MSDNQTLYINSHVQYPASGYSSQPVYGGYGQNPAQYSNNQANTNNQNQMMLQQGLLNQPVQYKVVEPLYIGHPRSHPRRSRGCMVTFCKMIGLLAASILGFFGYYLYHQISASSDYQTFQKLQPYQNDIAAIVQSCGPFITYGLQSLTWAEGMVLLAIVAGIITLFLPVVSLLGGIGYAAGSYYTFQLVNNNNCYQYAAQIEALVSGISNVPTDNYFDTYLWFMQAAGVYSLVLLIVTIAVCVSRNK